MLGVQVVQHVVTTIVEELPLQHIVDTWGDKAHLGTGDEVCMSFGEGNCREEL